MFTAASAQVRAGLGTWGVPSPPSPAGAHTPGMGWDGMGATALPSVRGLQDGPDDGEWPQGTAGADTTGAAQRLTPNTWIFGKSTRTFQPMKSFTHFGMLRLA